MTKSGKRLYHHLPILKSWNLTSMKPIDRFCNDCISATNIDGWSYMNLGCGNHLFIRTELTQAFLTKLKEKEIDTPVGLYHMWEEIGQEILADNLFLPRITPNINDK